MHQPERNVSEKTAEFHGTEIDEAALVAGLRRQDPRAYEQLIQEYGGRLLQVARRFLGEEEARDAVQEGLVSAFKSIDRFDAKAKVSTWLHRIVVNAALMRLRKKSRQMEESLEPLLPTYLEDGHMAEQGSAWPETPEQMLGRSEVRERVRRGIEQLPESYRSVILLRDIEGLSGQEAAEALGLSVTATKVRLHRARQALRKILDPYVRGEA
ncbi:MAG: sigma-70 family RNA polymerase sigma factor [Acidobacteriota bacterium]